MADTFDSDPNTLPPLTKAIVVANRTSYGTILGPVASNDMLRALIDAIHDLENRVIALEHP